VPKLLRILALVQLIGLSQVLAQAAGPSELIFRNPIRPGCYPDPSVCRVREDYYLVTSTFEYFLGIPIFQSKDLVHWTQIGQVPSPPSQQALDSARHETPRTLVASFDWFEYYGE
jgi:beta-xylosidase